MAALLAVDCVYAQGFHFDGPLPEADFTALLERQGASGFARIS